MSNAFFCFLAYAALSVLVLIGFILSAHYDRKKRDPFSEKMIDLLNARQPHSFKRRLQNVLVYTLAGLILLIIWPVAVPYHFYSRLSRKSSTSPYLDEDEDEDDEDEEFLVKMENLLQPVALVDIEEREIVSDPLEAIPALPFGHLNAAWESFKAKLLPDDALWSFALKAQDGASAARPDGYVILRNGEITAEFCAHFVGYPRRTIRF